MAANAVVVHRIAGRVRLRIDERRGDAAYFSDLSARLDRFGNVFGIKPNPVTGSITFHFTGSLDDVLRRAKAEEVLSVADGARANGAVASETARMASARLAGALGGQPVNLVSGRDINRDFMMGSTLLLVGLVQMFRGRWFPPAFSVLWYAREAFNLAGERRQAKAG